MDLPFDPVPVKPELSTLVNISDQTPVCCQGTVDLHGSCNDMMLCLGCTKIIKCFDDESKFRNFVRFCQSRKRRFEAYQYKSYLIVTYEKFTLS